MNEISSIIRIENKLGYFIDKSIEFIKYCNFNNKLEKVIRERNYRLISN